MSTTQPPPVAATDNRQIVTSLWHNMRLAALGTLEKDTMPHVSMVTISPLIDGTALLLLSDLARHTINIKRDDRCSLLVTGLVMSDPNQHDDPLAMERITIHGLLRLAEVAQTKTHEAEFIKHHPTAAQYIDFTDFSLYCFQPTKVFLVGGFGRIETLAAEILVQKTHQGT